MPCCSCWRAQPTSTLFSWSNRGDIRSIRRKLRPSKMQTILGGGDDVDVLSKRHCGRNVFCFTSCECKIRCMGVNEECSCAEDMVVCATIQKQVCACTLVGLRGPARPRSIAKFVFVWLRRAPARVRRVEGPLAQYRHVQDTHAAMSVVLDVAILLTGCLHVYLAPYTKVEESFNLHAVHDVLMYGTSSKALPNVCHFCQSHTAYV